VLFNMIVVSAPIGGYANHTMWLLWIHNKFSSNILPLGGNPIKCNTCGALDKSKTRKDDFMRYNVLRGIDWPDYKGLQETQLSENLKHEISEHRFITKVVKDKIKFILNEVYPPDRNNQNWLKVEHLYKNSVEDLGVSHKINQNTTVACTVDPDIALKNYFKLNRTNGVNTNDFIQEVKNFNESAKDHTRLVVNNSLLYQSKLDHNYYNTLVEYFNLDYQYENAQAVHSAWYNAQVRSEKDFLNLVDTIYERC